MAHVSRVEEEEPTLVLYYNYDPSWEAPPAPKPQAIKFPQDKIISQIEEMYGFENKQKKATNRYKKLKKYEIIKQKKKMI